MKKHITKLAALSLFAGIMVAMPAFVYAQDATTNAPSSEQAAPSKPQKHGVIPFHGKVSAVNTNAMTLTVGNRTFQVTADTKIFKDGQSATLSEGVVGEPVRGTYKKAAAGKLEALNVHFGAKSERKHKPAGPNGN
jgi:Domain of unknown function (DUF5666)